MNSDKEPNKDPLKETEPNGNHLEHTFKKDKPDGEHNYGQTEQPEELRLKEWIIPHLVAKGSIHFSWEGGSDEGFLTFEDYLEDNREIAFDFCIYLEEKLCISYTGEFVTSGYGRIFIDGNFIKVSYQSDFRATIDFNEETQEVIHHETENLNEEILFTL